MEIHKHKQTFTMTRNRMKCKLFRLFLALKIWVTGAAYVSLFSLGGGTLASFPFLSRCRVGPQ